MSFAASFAAVTFPWSSCQKPPITATKGMSELIATSKAYVRPRKEVAEITRIAATILLPKKAGPIFRRRLVH